MTLRREACLAGYVNTTGYSLPSLASAWTALEYRAELLAEGMGQMQELLVALQST